MANAIVYQPEIVANCNAAVQALVLMKQAYNAAVIATNSVTQNAVIGALENMPCGTLNAAGVFTNNGSATFPQTADFVDPTAATGVQGFSVVQTPNNWILLFDLLGAFVNLGEGNAVATQASAPLTFANFAQNV